MLERIQRGSTTYAVYEVYENMSVVDHISKNMINNNQELQIGLSPIQMESMNGMVERILFDITGKISLREYLVSIISQENFKRLLINLVDTIHNLDEYMIDIRQLLLDLDSVFINPIDHTVSLLCVVIKNYTDTNDLFRFFREIVETCHVETVADGKDYFHVVWNITRSENGFSLDNLKTVLVSGYTSNAPEREIPNTAGNGSASGAADNNIAGMYSEPSLVTVTPMQNQTPVIKKQETAAVEKFTPGSFAVESQTEEKKGILGRLMSSRKKAPAASNLNNRFQSGISSLKGNGAEADEVVAESAKGGASKPAEYKPTPNVSVQNRPAANVPAPNNNPPINRPPISRPPISKSPVKRPEIRSDELMAEMPSKSIRTASAAQKKPSVPNMNGQFANAAAANAQSGSGVLEYGDQYNYGMYVLNQSGMSNMPSSAGAGNQPMQTQVVFGGSQYMKPAGYSKPQGERSIVADRYKKGTPTVSGKYSQDYKPPVSQGKNTTHFDEGGQTVLLNMPSNTQRRMPFLIRLKFYERIVVDCAYFKIGKDKAGVNYCISDNDAVSRDHASIICKNGRFYVVDNHSTNHTFVNGQMIPSDTEIEIFNGSRIQFADEEFEFVRN